MILVQCKRQKEKVGRVVVKGLFADVKHEGADFGLIVTSSELSPAARETISARGSPIHEVEKTAIQEWLQRLRSGFL
jgi:restriction system protein